MCRLIVVFRLLHGLTAPRELRRLMRRMPRTPRLWVRTASGICPETDAEYLASDAQTYHPQQVLQLLQGLQPRNAQLPARRRAQELAHLLR
jgi:hypothetical protein